MTDPGKEAVCRRHWTFKAEKRTAQLSVHPQPCLRAQVIMQFAMSLQWWKEWVMIMRCARTSYLCKHDFLGAFYC